MTAKHTPGPWSMFSNGFAVGVCTHDSDVAWTFFEDRGLLDTARSRDEDEANARLIAAAPDLLQACIYLAEGIEACGLTGVYLDQARAAIAKATGEQP